MIEITGRTNEQCSEENRIGTDSVWVEGALSAKNDKSTIVLLDWHNVSLCAKKNGFFVNIDALDDWIHWHYNAIEKIVFIDSYGSDGIRAKFLRSGWTVYDSTNFGEEEEDQKQDLGRGIFNLDLALTLYDCCIRYNLGTTLIISGNGYFVPIVKRLLMRGGIVEVLSLKATLSRRLARLANRVHDLDSIVVPQSKAERKNCSRLEKLIDYTFETDAIGTHSNTPDCGGGE